MDKREGLDLPHVLMAVDRLARLHGVSYAFFQNYNFKEKYPSFNADMSTMGEFLGILLSAFYDGLITALEKKREEYEHLIEKMKSNRDTILKTFVDMVINTNGPRLTCLSHGDYWTNNFMFLNEDHSVKGSPPKDFMMIDWGVTYIRHPLLDVQYLVHSSTTLDLRRTHLEEILRHYHSIFTAVTTDLGARVDNWDFDTFMVEWQKTRLYGCLMGIVVNGVTLSTAGKSYKKGTISSNNTIANLQLWLARITAPLIMKTATSSMLKPVLLRNATKPFKPIVDELISWENEALQTRVLDLINDAYSTGVLDV